MIKNCWHDYGSLTHGEFVSSEITWKSLICPIKTYIASMLTPQCAQCFLHFLAYRTVPWKPVCHDFDILMWLSSSLLCHGVDVTAQLRRLKPSASKLTLSRTCLKIPWNPNLSPLTSRRIPCAHVWLLPGSSQMSCPIGASWCLGLQDVHYFPMKQHVDCQEQMK